MVLSIEYVSKSRAPHYINVARPSLMDFTSSRIRIGHSTYQIILNKQSTYFMTKDSSGRLITYQHLFMLRLSTSISTTSNSR